MKKLLFILLLLIGSLTARADEKADALLAKMSATMRGWKSYRVEFALRADPSQQQVMGSYVVSGQRYRLAAAGREVFSDGTLKYEVNPEDKEVVIDKINPKDRSILSNPTKIFDFSSEIFNSSYAGQVTRNGRKCDRVVLSPRGDDHGITQVSLLLDAANGLPAGLDYLLDGVSEPVEIDITDVKQITAPADGDFRFDKAKFKGYEIIDFR